MRNFTSNSRRKVVLLTGLLLISPGSAWAELITFGFTGTVDQITDPYNVLDGAVWPQAGFAGQFRFNSEAEDLNSSAEYGRYRGEDFLMTMQLGSLSFDSSAGHEAITVDASAWALFNGLDLFAGGFDVGLFYVQELEIDFHRPDYPYFTDDSLPLEPPPLDIFQDRELKLVGSNGVNIRGTINSLYVVPEPASCLLLSLICGALIVRRTKKGSGVFFRQ